MPPVLCGITIDCLVWQMLSPISMSQLAASSAFIDANTPALICCDGCDDTLPAAIAAGHVATSEVAAGNAPDWSAARAQVTVRPLACACVCEAVSQRAA